MINPHLIAKQFEFYLDLDLPVYQHPSIGSVALIRKCASTSLEFIMDDSDLWQKTPSRKWRKSLAMPVNCLIRHPFERLVSGLRTVMLNPALQNLYTPQQIVDQVLEQIAQGKLIFDCHTYPQTMNIKMITEDQSQWRCIPMVGQWQQQVEREWSIQIDRHENKQLGQMNHDVIIKALNDVPHAVDELLWEDFELWHSLTDN